MITRFVEVTDGFVYGKFLVCRLDPGELATKSAMPGAGEWDRLLTFAGRRRFNERTTLIVDLQVGTAFAWPLENGEIGFRHYIDKHYARSANIIDGDPPIFALVCPLYLPFVLWLHEQGKWAEGAGDIEEIPRYLDLRTDEALMPSGPVDER